jgi:hypothetical protein
MNRGPQSLSQSIADVPNMPGPGFTRSRGVWEELVSYWYSMWEVQVNAIRTGKNTVLARPPHSGPICVELWCASPFPAFLMELERCESGHRRGTCRGAGGEAG